MKAAPVPKRKEMSEILWGALVELFARAGLNYDRKEIDRYMRTNPAWRCFRRHRGHNPQGRPVKRRKTWQSR